MTTVSLWLSNREEPELYMTAFVHPLLPGEIRCVRGKAEGAYGGYGTFQWSAAVRALTVFFMRAKYMAPGIPIMQGENGSTAASLDYALGKLPVWLVEMFGRDSHGTSLSYRIIERTNPERKHPGPVALALNHQSISSSEISIYCDGNLIAAKDELEYLANQIESPSHSQILAGPPSTLVGDLAQRLQKMVFDECTSALDDTSTFSNSGTELRIKDLSQYSRFRTLAGKGAKQVERLAEKRSASARLGVAGDEDLVRRALTSESIRVVVSLAQVGSLVLFLYLKNIKKYSIDINLRFPHSVRLVEHILDEGNNARCDLCVLTIAPAAGLLGAKQSEFLPLMLMPSQSYRVIQPIGTKKNGNKQYNGHYLVLTEEYSSAHFRLDGLRERGLINDKRSVIEHRENDEVFEALLKGDSNLRTILGFPFHQLLTDGGFAENVGDELDEIKFRDTMLFGTRDFLGNNERRRFLEIAVRDAWLELREDPATLSALVKDMLQATEYTRLARRFSGLHQI